MTQQTMWSSSGAAAAGALLERLAAWCDSQKHMTFALRLSSMMRLHRPSDGGKVQSDTRRGWVIDVFKRKVSIHTLTAGDLEELARVGNLWLDERRAKK